MIGAVVVRACLDGDIEATVVDTVRAGCDWAEPLLVSLMLSRAVLRSVTEGS
jgi:hypothetical protein